LNGPNRALFLGLLAGLPGLLVLATVALTGALAPKVWLSLGLLHTAVVLGASARLRHEVTLTLATVANLAAALRAGDFAVRGALPPQDGPARLAISELNTLADELREERLVALEATGLLREVMEAIDVALFGFDDEGRLRLVNGSGERLMGRPSVALIGLGAQALGLSPLLAGQVPRTLQSSALIPDAMELRRASFRSGGLPHTLVVLTDLHRALRQEERAAWQRLVRVLGHEINNSLAPIQSLAEGLVHTVNDKPDDWEDDVARGLGIIGRRAGGLHRFMASYAALSRVPEPTKADVDAGAWVRRVAGLETRMEVTVLPGPEAAVSADADQLDQVLINLVRNAVEAAAETGGGVELSWEIRGEELVVCVLDSGPGLSDTANLFVPFFTTKAEGTGIGLVLSRQIVEAHGGRLTLQERSDPPGCLARIRLPGARSGIPLAG
jgi:two-component system, NtrC family, nitrogen regulation sensor histidine kinase NtrY